MEPLHAERTTRGVSIHEFNRSARSLLREEYFAARAADPTLSEEDKRAVEVENGAALAKFVTQVLTGVDQETFQQMVIDHGQHAVTRDWAKENLSGLWDYDSLLGFSDTLPFLDEIQVYPVPRFEDSLTKTTHLFRTFRVAGTVRISSLHASVVAHVSQRYRVGLHRIPNIALCTSGTTRRHITRIAFPALMDVGNPNSTRAVPAAHLRAIYDTCIRPSIIDIMPWEAGHWPPSYDAEFKRIQTSRGLQFGTQQVPAEHVKEFGDLLLHQIHSQPWGHGAFYLHQIRGVRQATQHPDGEQAESIQEFLRGYNIDLIDKANFWVDVGYTIHSDGHVLMPRKDGHWRVLRKFLGLSDDEAHAYTNTHKCKFDPACQLSMLGGFHTDVNPTLAQSTTVEYIQMYNSEKNPTYRLTRERGQPSIHLTMQDLVAKGFPAIDRHVKGLGEIYESARQHTPGHCRIEARISLANVFRNRFAMTAHDVCNMVVAIPRTQWW